MQSLFCELGKAVVVLKLIKDLLWLYECNIEEDIRIEWNQISLTSEDHQSRAYKIGKLQCRQIIA